jgi:hypothetical protein
MVDAKRDEAKDESSDAETAAAQEVIRGISVY